MKHFRNNAKKDYTSHENGISLKGEPETPGFLYIFPDLWKGIFGMISEIFVVWAERHVYKY